MSWGHVTDTNGPQAAARPLPSSAHGLLHGFSKPQRTLASVVSFVFMPEEDEGPKTPG